VRDRFKLQGIEVSPGTPEELAAFIKRDYQSMDALIRQLKIVLD
jgi:tripartite-type tricarboxylate transporter receptor subunit TctC